MDIKELELVKERVDGTWFPYGDEASLLIASTEAPSYQRAVAKASRKYPPHKIKKDQTIQAAIALEAAAQALLLDFKGFEENGVPLENTLENRRKLLSFPAIRNFVADNATDLGNFQREGEASDVAALKSGD
jgi:hypothetical protein